ncbi:MAG: hypothetical protein AB1404_00180 [Spirochaetota bacterium]
MDDFMLRRPLGQGWYGLPENPKNLVLYQVMSKKYVLFAFGVALFLSLGTFLFFSRSAVFILTDETELLLYGNYRALLQTVKAAARLLRPVYMVSVPQVSDEALQRDYLEQKLPERSIIITPSRFEQASQGFKNRHPSSVVLILERQYIIDYKSDVKRAAEIAGPLAKKTDQTPGLLLPSSMDDTLRETLKQTFDEGLAEKGWSHGSILIDEAREVPSNLSSILTFPTNQRLQNASVPIILFSSINDDFLPRSVIAVFDDSFWPHIAEMVVFYEKNVKMNFNSVLRTRNYRDNYIKNADN